VAILRDLDRPVELMISLTALARFNLDQGDPAEAKHYYEEAVTVARTAASPWYLAVSLHAVGFFHVHLNELAQARPYFEEALAVAETIDGRVGIAHVLSSLALTYKNEDATASRQYFQRALDMLRELKLGSTTFPLLNNWGFAALRWGAYDEALQLLHEALALALETGFEHGGSHPHSNLARVYLQLGDLALARTHFVEGLRGFRNQNNRRVLRGDMLEGAELRYVHGDAVGAVELLGLREGHPNDEWQDELDALSATLEAELSPDEFAAAWARGQALDLDTVVDALIAEFGETP
jgi:tetratricopeptide (TPR) repeat protein